MIDNSQLADRLEVVVFRANGTVKDTRFVRPFLGINFEFIPNKFYLTLINKGHIKPNTWKVPFLFGTWKAKRIINGNS